MKIIAAREKFLSRPISELDLSACERCGHSPMRHFNWLNRFVLNPIKQASGQAG